MFIKRHLEKKRPLEKTGIEWRRKKTVFALVPFGAFANTDWGQWVVCVKY
jgi:hypothetical protein